jgi:hypothetical protein
MASWGMRRPASAQSRGGFSVENTSEVSLDGTKREVGLIILTEDTRGPSTIEGLRFALREELRDDDISSFELAPPLALMMMILF